MDATSFIQKRAQLRKLERLLQGSRDCSKSETHRQPSVPPTAAAPVSVPSLALTRHAHGQLVSTEPAPLAKAAVPLTSVRSEQEEALRNIHRLAGREGSSTDAEEDVDTFCSVAQVRLAYKKRMRGMEAAQKRMHLGKVRHTTKRSHIQHIRQHPVVARPEQQPPSECEEAANEAALGDARGGKQPTHVTLDGLSFRKYSVDLEYRNTITRSCRSALMQGQMVVLQAPLFENDNDPRECRTVLQSVYMQVSALTRADIVPEATVDSQAACTTMTLQPKR